MRRVIAVSALVATLLGVSAPPAHAGKSTDIALGLASFAVFNQVVGPFLNPHRFDGGYHRRAVVYQTVVQEPRVIYEAPAPVVYVVPAPPPAYPTVVQYPHGRYELRLQGAQYVWVWIPAVPPPPPPPPAQ